MNLGLPYTTIREQVKEGRVSKANTIGRLIRDEPFVIIDDVIKYHHKLTLLYEYLEKKQIIYQIIQLDEDDGIMIIGGE